MTTVTALQLCGANTTREPLLIRCIRCTSGGASIISFALVDAVLLLVLICGVLLGRRGRRAAPSHSDVITYHLVAMEMASVVGLFCFCDFIYRRERTLALAGYGIMSMSVTGQTLLQVLTCLDRYLAVIRPVAYRGLRRQVGVRLRNAVIACMWLTSVVAACVVAWTVPLFPTWLFAVMFSVLVVTMVYCTVSVLCFLVGAQPGRNRKPYARAFRLIVCISATILLRFSGMIAFNVVANRLKLSSGSCLLVLGGVWMYLPSSLVMPLMTIQRNRIPGCFSCST